MVGGSGVIELVGVQPVKVIVGVNMIVGLLTAGEVTRVPVIVSAVNDGVDVEEVTRVPVIAEDVNDGIDVVESTLLQSNGTKRKK